MDAISSQRPTKYNNIGYANEAEATWTLDLTRSCAGGAVAIAEAVELCYGPPSAADWRRVFMLIALQFLRRLSGFDDGGRGWDHLNERLLGAHETLLQTRRLPRLAAIDP